MTTQKQAERNRLNAIRFRTVTGRQVCFGARHRNRACPIGAAAPVPRGGYLHNGNWRPVMRAYV